MRVGTILLASPLVLAMPLPRHPNVNDLPETLRHDLISFLGNRLRLNDWAAHSQTPQALSTNDIPGVTATSSTDRETPEEQRVLLQLEADLLPDILATKSAEAAHHHMSPTMRTPIEIAALEVPVGYTPHAPCHDGNQVEHTQRTLGMESRTEVLIVGLVFAFFSVVLLVESLLWLKKRIQTWNCSRGAIRLPDEKKSEFGQCDIETAKMLAYGVQNGEC